MKIQIEKKYFLIPILYVCVIGIFLYLHFAGNQTFTEEYGEITFSWTTSSTGRGKGGLSSAVISGGGVQFAFNEEQGIEAVTDNNTMRPLSLSAYELGDEGFSISFQGGISLRFFNRGGPEKRITIAPEQTGDAGNIKAIRIPYSLEEGSSREQPSQLPLLIIDTAEDEKTFLSVSPASRIDTEKSQLILNRENADFSRVIIEQPQNSEINPYAYWFARGNSFEETAEQYRAALDSFVNNAYSGWSSRYTAAEGGWSDGEGTVRFREKTAAAFLAEALSRDEYDAVLTLIRSSVERNEQQLTFLTAPFLGNLPRHVSTLQQRDSREIQAIEELLRDEDPALITRDNLLRFIIGHGPFSLVQEVLRFTESLDPTELPPEQCLGLIKMYNQRIEGIAEADRILEPLALSAQEKLLAHIRRNSDGLFVRNRGGSFDVPLSIETGKHLIIKGNNDGSTPVIFIGQELLRSSLNLADENGIVQAFDQTVLPEDIYPVLIENRFYPHEISLFDELGPGSWIWTIADFTAINAEQDGLTLSFTFPAEETHHMILQGVEPFTQLQMRGIPWRSDPAFERYPLGWIYNQAAETLSVKLTHETEEETITISY